MQIARADSGRAGARIAVGGRAGALLWAMAGMAAVTMPVSAAAQLRPLEPLPWDVFLPGVRATAWLGLRIIGGQRASLAGTEGRLLELGRYEAAWRNGRVALELGGSALRVFDDRFRWAAPAGGATLRFGRRVDAGELRVATDVRLTPPAWPEAAVLRFGARLPIGSHLRGLDREETDFLATLGLASRRGGLLAAAEAGIGILGTRIPDFTQEDDLVYTARLAYRLGPVRPEAVFTGQSSPLHFRRPRGVEDLRELRLGVRLGRARWIEALWVHGFTAFSPRSGMLLFAGIALPRPIH